MNHNARLALIAAWILLASAWGTAAGKAAERPCVRLTLAAGAVEGLPVAWSGQRVLLLSTAGNLWDLGLGSIQKYEQIPCGFRPVTQREMRGLLMQEFHRSYDVSGTGHYLVVHPAGQRDQWAPRFETLYRSFAHYFAARGLQISQPEFPLVAIAFSSQRDFAAYLQARGVQFPAGVVGFYCMADNRILLYDLTPGQSDAQEWSANYATILHEATHQIAFNTAVHNRFAPPPRWLAEGLAMMFETRGVLDPRRFPDRRDRINTDRLTAFLRYQAAARPADRLTHLVGQPEHCFATDPLAAYAESWAFSFFLAEKEPARYVQYLKATAARSPLQEFTDTLRTQEFTRVFGTNLTMLDARFLRFVRELQQDLQ